MEAPFQKLAESFSYKIEPEAFKVCARLKLGVNLKLCGGLKLCASLKLCVSLKVCASLKGLRKS